MSRDRVRAEGGKTGMSSRAQRVSELKPRILLEPDTWVPQGWLKGPLIPQRLL